MISPDPSDHCQSPTPKRCRIKFFGLGGAGGNFAAELAKLVIPEIQLVAANTDLEALARLTDIPQIHLGAQLTRGLGAGGDAEIGRVAAEADLSRIREYCADADLIMIGAGMGGGTGTGAAPVFARAATESGALVLGMVTLPFDCEGPRRQQQAHQGVAQLKASADGVICLPNQTALNLVNPKATLLETFALTNHYLADGVLGITRLITHPGILQVDFADLCQAVRGRHLESGFASAKAEGQNRSREVLDRLFASPFLQGGQLLLESESVLVSIMGGPDLTMAEVDRIMEPINRQCANARLILGAAVSDPYKDQVSVTLIASRPQTVSPQSPEVELNGGTRATKPSDNPERLLPTDSSPRPSYRFVAPPPELPPEKKQELFVQQNATHAARRPRRALARMRQGVLPLEIVSKGRFEKSEPTILHGQDLDVPTYIRRGVPLN